MRHGSEFGTPRREAPVSVELVCDVACELGESPVWDERRREIFWCDIPAGLVHRLDIATGVHRQIRFEDSVGSLGLCESGRLIVASGMSILLVDPDTEARTQLRALPETDFPCRLNDGRVGPDGAFWVGTIHDVALDRIEPKSVLWRITGASAAIVATGLTAANGLAFSQDGRWLWRSDSVQQWVWRHPFDATSGAMGPGSEIRRPDEAEGRPDGAAFDVDGVYWSAGVSAGVLNGFDADGERVARIALPAPHPTMPCFGGDDFRTLFVTSHTKSMTDAQRQANPLAGKLLSMRMERPGFASPRFDDGGL